jgi:hypothetical protein
MHIAHLVLYTEDNPHEQAMMQMQRILYDNANNNTLGYTVHTVYYTYSFHVRDYAPNDTECTVRIPGHESFVPGILNKTWSAFQWAMGKMRPFDYMVRSNTSTLINFDKLVEQLRETPVEYGGIHTFTLNWQDAHSGVYNTLHYGTTFASGTCIIWNAPTFELFMREGEQHLDRTLVDDLAIGVVMKRLGKTPTNFSSRIYVYDKNTHSPLVWLQSTIHYLNKSPAAIEEELATHGPNAIAFRHRAHENRTSDVKLMALSLRYLLRWQRATRRSLIG